MKLSRIRKDETTSYEMLKGESVLQVTANALSFFFFFFPWLHSSA